MSSLKDILTHITHKGEQSFDSLKNSFAERLNLYDNIAIHPFLGFGTKEKLVLRGRVLANQSLSSAEADDTIWENLLNSYQRLDSDEIGGARVRMSLGDLSTEAITNEEGYFVAELAVNGPPPAGRMWQEVSLTLIDPPAGNSVTAIGRIMVPMEGATFGIISDIDDTVLQSSATNYVKAARLMFLKNARTRLPFQGVAAFYQMLQQGDGKQSGRNPVFYVSSSPWNLYDLLTDFFEFQNVPTGPLFLKDYGIEAKQLLTSGHGKHKMAQIDTILSMYPDMSFLLIGDSGQKDPEIYREVIKTYPNRIKAIYIRDVSDEERDAEVRQIAAEVNDLGVDMILAPDSYTAAEHAAKHGYLPADKLGGIRANTDADLADPDELDALLGA